MRRLTLVLCLAGLAALASAWATALGSNDASRILRLNVSDYRLETFDPALGYDFVTWRLANMTCLKLMSYPDKGGTAGSKLVPEASFPPRVSADGRTYSFTVRSGLRFADGRAITAESFARAVERSLDPKQQGYGGLFLSDLVGATAVLDGKATRPAGLKVQGSTISFRLQRPAPDFLYRIALNFYCAVPSDTPVTAKGVSFVPGSGPYTVTSVDPGRGMVLRQNPYYSGTRLQRWDEVRVVFGTEVNASLLQVRRGEVDLDLGALPGPANAALAKEFGVNTGRYRVTVIPTINYLALNTSRPFFRNRANRQAVAYAVDRTAITRVVGAYGGKANDQILPPGIPGYRDVTIFPNTPQVEKAKQLLDGRTGKVVLYTPNDANSRAVAQIVRANLKRVGIDVTVKEWEFSVHVAKTGRRGEPFDINVIGWFADYPDPYDFINVLLSGTTLQESNNINTAYWNDPVFNRRMEQAALLRGDARAAAYARLDRDITREAPIVVTGNSTTREFLSANVRCPMASAPWAGLNLLMLCPRR
jgi:peptide/nickel transport system substrate-binding protein